MLEKITTCHVVGEPMLEVQVHNTMPYLRLLVVVNTLDLLHLYLDLPTINLVFPAISMLPRERRDRFVKLNRVPMVSTFWKRLSCYTQLKP